MERKWVKTKDGSPSLYVPELKQNYHSLHGALQESRHVFIKSGLHHFSEKPELKILEVGFGTGLNALLTHFEKTNPNQKIYYHSLEKYPLEEEEWSAIHWPELFLASPEYHEFYNQAHQAKWNQIEVLNNHFELQKTQIDLVDFEPPGMSYDLIYFDAFSPEAQPKLWTKEVFSRLYKALKMDGILVTYCVKGSVRRAMEAAQFEVEKIPGPPGKREMSRAIKS